MLKIMEGENVSSNNKVSLSDFREKTDNEYFIDVDIESKIITNVINYIEK
jgi:hypothetical protein